MRKCDRCDKEISMSKMSKMNLDILCQECITEEMNHPKYEEASDADHNELVKGNRNYPGLFHGQKWPFGYEMEDK